MRHVEEDVALRSHSSTQMAVTVPGWVTALARGLLWLEPLLLACLTLTLWLLPTGQPEGLWLLALLVPLLAARWVCYGHVLTRTPLDPWFAAFLILGIINIYTAPYSAGLPILARPLLGMATYYALVERARVSGMNGPIQVTIMLSLLIGVQALGGTEWSVKSGFLRVITDALPSIQTSPDVPGLNANEIAGGMIWLLPLMAGIAIYRWQKRAVRWDVTLAFLMLFIAMLLGQSRSALIGLMVGLALIVQCLLAGKWRFAGWALIGAIVALEIVLLAKPLNTTKPTAATETGLSRTEATVDVRQQTWASALSIIRDYPVSGVGLAMFGDRVVREQYPLSYQMDNLSHAHNEYLQVTVDMGIPGLLVFLGLYGAVARMLMRTWRAGHAEMRVLSVAVGAGLLAHAVFGLGDAITLWGRFGFIFWLLLGLAGAIYVHGQRPPDTIS